MGIGGGSFGVPLMRLYGLPIHRAVGTASGFGLMIAIPSVTGFLMQGWGAPGLPPCTVGLVNLPAFLVVIGVTMVTTTWGVHLAHAMNPRPLKLAFAVFIMLMAANMLRKALWRLGRAAARPPAAAHRLEADAPRPGSSAITARRASGRHRPPRRRSPRRCGGSRCRAAPPDAPRRA